MTTSMRSLQRTAPHLALALLTVLGGCASPAQRTAPRQQWQGGSIATPVAQGQRFTPAPSQPYAAPPVAQAQSRSVPPARGASTAGGLPQPTVRRDGMPQPTAARGGPVPVRAAATPATATDPGRFVYRFRAGDEVGIDVWQEKDLSGVQRVLRDGTISPPLLEPMHIVGSTIKQVRARLIAQYREYLKEPRITVRVASVQSDRMFILGEVKTPKAVQIFGPMTLMQGIAEAGGFNEAFADKQTIRIVRQVAGGPSQILTVNANSVLSGRRRDLAMQAGDIVFVHPTGLTDWSRKFTQALDPVAGLLGAAGDAAAIALIARD